MKMIFTEICTLPALLLSTPTTSGGDCATSLFAGEVIFVFAEGLL